jgi:hypothetical protein
MTGASIAIDDATAADSILSVKRRVFAANRQLPVRRQRLVYRPGPHGINPLADEETLGGAGMARDDTTSLDVLLTELTEEDLTGLGRKVCRTLCSPYCCVYQVLLIISAFFTFCSIFHACGLYVIYVSSHSVD